jgi:hypothetical protein
MDWRDGGIAYGAEECCLARQTSPEKQKGRKTKTGGINPPLQNPARLGRRLLQKQASVEKDD